MKTSSRLEGAFFNNFENEDLRRVERAADLLRKKGFHVSVNIQFSRTVDVSWR